AAARAGTQEIPVGILFEQIKVPRRQQYDSPNITCTSMRNAACLPARLATTVLCLSVWLAAWPRADAAEEVFITEFMASNSRTLMDRDREYSDWIEIHNSGSAPANLAGWSLTDKPWARALRYF